MVATNQPLEEKMALFWHGHFATGEEKVRDYRKMEHSSRCCTAGDRQFPHAADRGGARAGDARLSRCRREREGRAQREFRPRGDGTLHHGRRQLHREGYPRGGARLHRLDRRRPRLQGRRQQARRRRERRFSAKPAISTASISSTSSWSSRSPPNTSPARSIDSSCARTFRRTCRRDSARCCAITTTRSRRCCARSSCRGISTAQPRSAPTSRGRSNWSCRPIASSGVTALPGIPDLNMRQPRARPDAAQPADRRRLGAGPRLDHAGAVARHAAISPAT